MPRELTFKIKQKEYITTPVKVERKKLYGWTEILALDENGNPCKLVITDQTGTVIIPKGGTAMAILSPEGEWVDRSTLKTINQDGTTAKLIPSSYSTTITLSDKMKEEDFLDYSITDFYQLTDISDDFIKALGKDIYVFEYTYLDSYETTTAFLMVTDNILYMLLGYKNKFEMLCLGDCKTIDDDDDEYIFVDDDLDFSMF